MFAVIWSPCDHTNLYDSHMWYNTTNASSALFVLRSAVSGEKPLRLIMYVVYVNARRDGRKQLETYKFIRNVCEH